MDDFNRVINDIQSFQTESLKERIANLEATFSSVDNETLPQLLTEDGVGDGLLRNAFQIKQLAGQINVTVHAIGILLSLHYILEEGEQVESLSLGAGNTGKKFDLETDRRVAEYKFIQWRGGAEAIRQNQLFKDFFYLAEHKTTKDKYLYVLGTKFPLKFLNGGRSFSSVLSKNERLRDDFRGKYGTKYEKVRDYFADMENEVRITDLGQESKLFKEFILQADG